MRMVEIKNRSKDLELTCLLLSNHAIMKTINYSNN
jgi:hypothetical protein